MIRSSLPPVKSQSLLNRVLDHPKRGKKAASLTLHAPGKGKIKKLSAKIKISFHKPEPQKGKRRLRFT